MRTLLILCVCEKPDLADAEDIRVFHKHAELAIMTILTSEALPHEDKKQSSN